MVSQLPRVVDEARIITPSHLIGAAEACTILGCTRSTLTRRVAAGKLTPITKLDGPKGPFVFDRHEIEHLAQTGDTDE